MNASASPSGAVDRYVTVQKPPKLWPSTLHGAPPNSRRMSSASATIASARNMDRYLA